MPLVVPNPTVPTNGQSLDAAPLLANLNAVYQAIQQFDASQVQAGTLVASAFNANINPNTLLKETTSPFVSTGLIWSIVSGLSGTMTGGVIYYNGIRVSVNSVPSNTFLASKDTYIDIDVNGNVTYQAVTTNTSSPAITANSVRVGVAVAGASLTLFNQGSTAATAPVISGVTLTVVDSLGNMIYPNNPSGGLIGFRPLLSPFGTASTTVVPVTALSLPVINPVLGKRLKITAFCSAIQATAAAKATALTIWDGTVGSGTQLAAATFTFPYLTQNYSLIAQAIVTPSAGLKTYNIGLVSDAGGGVTTTIQGASASPAFVAVEIE